MGALSEISGEAAIGEMLESVAGKDGDIEELVGAVSGLRSGGDGHCGSGALDYLAGIFGAAGFYQAGSVSASGLQTIASAGLGTMYFGSIPGISGGNITSGYGYRKRFRRMHKGVDIAMAKGDTVRSALAGIVRRIGYEANGYGNYVVVEHENGMETRYAHLTMSLVGKGQYVEAGQPIALSGNTGNSTGPHLHFETRYMGSAVDPASVFDFSGGFAGNFARAVEARDERRIATGFNSKGSSLKSKSTYVVRPGDTVRKIAGRAGISSLRLCQLNFITEDQELEAGTMLKLR